MIPSRNLKARGPLFVAGFFVLLSIFGAPAAHAQYVYGLVGVLHILPGSTNAQGLADVETDYSASYYYKPRTDGFIFVNGQQVASSVGNHYNGPNGNGCSTQFDGYFCLAVYINFPGVVQPGSDYTAQLNAWVTPIYHEVVNSTIVYQDFLGFSLISVGDYTGASQIDP